MAKIETELKNIKDELMTLKNQLNELKFNIVRIMGTLEKGVGMVSQTEDGGGAVTGSVSVDLGPLEDRIEKLEKKIATRDAVEKVIARLDELVSEKIKSSEQMQERANNLLEKGMELVELNSVMLEVKNLLEERIIGDIGKEAEDETKNEKDTDNKTEAK